MLPDGTSFANAASAADCFCKATYYLKEAELSGGGGGRGNASCHKCDSSSMVCEEAGVRLEQLVLSPGHWRMYNTSEAISGWVPACFNPEACLGGAPQTSNEPHLQPWAPCDPCAHQHRALCDHCLAGVVDATAEAPWAPCAEGHTGPFCAVCKPRLG